MSIDWDAWRAQHATLTFNDQQAFYRRIAAAHPWQRSFHLPTVQEAFDHIDDHGLHVVELGGWDGALAHAMLNRGDIATWRNYDIVGVPQVCTDPRYGCEVLSDYLWNRDSVRADVFVACHTIEHLTASELTQLLDVLDVNYLYLEAPLPSVGAPDWTRYEGSHILEWNWPQVEEALVQRGYRSCATNLWQSDAHR